MLLNDKITFIYHLLGLVDRDSSTDYNQMTTTGKRLVCIASYWAKLLYAFKIYDFQNMVCQ